MLADKTLSLASAIALIYQRTFAVLAVTPVFMRKIRDLLRQTAQREHDRQRLRLKEFSEREREEGRYLLYLSFSLFASNV